MYLLHRALAGAMVVGLAGMTSALAQAPAQPADTAAPPQRRLTLQKHLPLILRRPAPAKKTYTVPAGTKVLLQVRSAINTKSAKPGDGIYLASTFPVVVGTRVMIPAGVYVQGVVDRVARAGHVKGRAQLDLHFTSIIFPMARWWKFPASLTACPGPKTGRSRATKAPWNRTATKATTWRAPRRLDWKALGWAPSAGAAAGHPLAGAAIGGLGGVVVGTVVALFTRGDDINIESGTPVEMVLQRPLILEDENLSGGTSTGVAPVLVPTANQPKPIEKPRRTRVICPPGGLGCE